MTALRTDPTDARGQMASPSYPVRWANEGQTKGELLGYRIAQLVEMGDLRAAADQAEAFDLLLDRWIEDNVRGGDFPDERGDLLRAAANAAHRPGAWSAAKLREFARALDAARSDLIDAYAEGFEGEAA